MKLKRLYLHIVVIFTVSICAVDGKLMGQSSQQSQQRPWFTPHLFSLDSGWHSTDHQSYQLPFILPPSHEAITLTYRWEINCTLPDTFYLYLTGVAWQAELSLNNRYVSINDFPLSPWVVPVARNWINESTNVLQLTLEKGLPLKNMPRPFLGITGEVYILDREQLTYWQTSPLSQKKYSDTVVVWAPYIGTEDEAYKDSIAFQQVYHLLETGHKQVYFPYPPTRRLRTLFATLDLVEVDSLTSETYVGMLNPYPYAPVGFALHNKFWLDKTGKRTSHYGTFFRNRTPFQQALTFKPWPGFILLTLFPLLAMLIVKLVNSNFFYALHRLYMKPDVYIDTLNEVTGGNIGFVLILIIIKIFMYATLMSVTIYYIAWTNNWDLLNLFSDRSLLFGIYYPSGRMNQIFLRSMGIVITWQLIKFLIHNIAGSLFNIRNFAIGGFNIDISALFPYFMVVAVPLIASLLTSGSIYIWEILAFGLAMLIYLRQLYIVYLGLERLFNFSLGVKILYICAFKVVPYIIWF